jgi:hypothetical protein
MTGFNLERPAKQLTDALCQGATGYWVSLADARKAVQAAQSAPVRMP